MKRILAIALLAAAIAMPQAAYAANYLQGDVNYTGDFSIPGTTFLDSASINIDLAAVSNTTSGDFASVFGMNFPDLLDHASPIEIVAPLPSYSPLWSFPAGGPYTVQFILTSYVVSQKTAGFLDLNGVGYFVATGFDNTPGKWNLSAQLETGQITATYSAGSIVQVPEPASITLLGLGLLGVAGALRRSRK